MRIYEITYHIIGKYRVGKNILLNPQTIAVFYKIIH